VVHAFTSAAASAATRAIGANRYFSQWAFIAFDGFGQEYAPPSIQDVLSSAVVWILANASISSCGIRYQSVPTGNAIQMSRPVYF